MVTSASREVSRRGFLGLTAGGLAGGAAVLLAPQARAIERAPSSKAVRQLGPIGNGWYRTEVKWSNNVRGFGFLTPGECNRDIFFHVSTLRRCGFERLEVGQIVQARFAEARYGLVATNMRRDV
jgi:Cold shock proteins